MARPTKFKEEYIEQAKKLCSLGATTADLAEFFKVNPSTVKLWMVTNAKFSATINDQKAFSNAKVVRSLTKLGLRLFQPAEEAANQKGQSDTLSSKL